MDVEDIISRDLRDLKEELEVMVSTGRISQRQYEKIMVIRKKGKNKKAAQGCRAKKQEEIGMLWFIEIVFYYKVWLSYWSKPKKSSGREFKHDCSNNKEERVLERRKRWLVEETG